MIISILLAGLPIEGLVAAHDATITSMPTGKPTYTVLAPTNSPTLDLFRSVTFIWSAEGYNVGGYFCRPSTTSSGSYSYTSWMPSQAAVTYSGLTTYTAEYVGSAMFASNYEFPATCFFGMATDTKDGPESTGGGCLFVELTSFPGDVTVSISMTTSDTQETSTVPPLPKTAFVTATSTVPPTYTVQPTAIQPSSVATIPDALPEPEDDLSGGEIAGIIVGSVGGAFLVGFAIWRKTVRQKTSTLKARLSGFKKAFAPIKATFGKKFSADEPVASNIELGDVAHEMSVSDQVVRIFELESPPQRYTNGLHELPEE